MRTEHCGVMVNHGAHIYEGRLNSFRSGTVNCPGTLHSQAPDPAFMERLQRRVTEDRPILDRLATLERVEAQDAHVALTWLRGLPLGMFIGANRYDTDDMHVLHLWTEAGESFDVMWPRRPGPVKSVDPPKETQQ